jgi:Flp pilus assembly protein TadG
MRFRYFIRDESGAAAVEFGLTSPIYIFVLFGVFQISIWLWTDFALHRGVEAAARCAAVTPSICNTDTATKQFASKQSYGMNVPTSAFTVSKTTCGTTVGYKVSGTYAAFDFTKGLGMSAFTASASACYPAT